MAAGTTAVNIMEINIMAVSTIQMPTTKNPDGSSPKKQNLFLGYSICPLIFSDKRTIII